MALSSAVEVSPFACRRELVNATGVVVIQHRHRPNIACADVATGRIYTIRVLDAAVSSFGRHDSRNLRRTVREKSNALTCMFNHAAAF